MGRPKGSKNKATVVKKEVTKKQIDNSDGYHFKKPEVGVIKAVENGFCSSCGHPDSSHTHGDKRACVMACTCNEYK